MSTNFGFPSCDRKKDRPYLFVSYKSEEWRTAAKYAGYLRDNGINIYYDDALEYAKDWEGELLDSIIDEGCAGVILMVTHKALDSPHITNELSTANHIGKPVLGVFMENAVL